MPIYICTDCDKEFDHKSNYERHINRKNKCTDMTAYKKRKLSAEKIESELKKKFEEELNEKIKNVNIIIEEKVKQEIELLKKDISKEYNHNSTINNITTNNNDNSIINNNDNSINTTNNINLLQYINNNYPNAKNFEDCFKKENITDDMKKKCDNKYYYDGAVYLITELGTKDESTRPIHCADASRRNFIIKRDGKWEKDIGGEKIKQEIVPLVDNVYFDIYNKKYEKNGNMQESLKNIEFLEIKTMNKRFKKMMDRSASYFLINKKHKKCGINQALS